MRFKRACLFTSDRITCQVSLTGTSLHFIPLWALSKSIGSEPTLRHRNLSSLPQSISAASLLYRTPSGCSILFGKNCWENRLPEPRMDFAHLWGLLKNLKQLQQPIYVKLEMKVSAKSYKFLRMLKIHVCMEAQTNPRTPITFLKFPIPARWTWASILKFHYEIKYNKDAWE